MIKPLSLVLIVTLLAVSPAFAQDANRAEIEQTAEARPAPNTAEPQERQSSLQPPQAQPDTSTKRQAATTSHKKRNIIIAAVAAAAVGVAVAAHKGVYGSSKGYYVHSPISQADFNRQAISRCSPLAKVELSMRACEYLTHQ